MFSSRVKSSRFGRGVLDDRLDDESRDARVGQRDDARDPADRRVRVGWREPALGGQLAQRFGDAGPRGVGGAEARVVQLHLVAGERRDLRDPRAHRPGADHGDGRVGGQGGAPSAASCQRPVNFGGRLAMNAATPSR